MKVGLLFELGKTVLLKFLASFFLLPRCSQFHLQLCAAAILLAEDNLGVALVMVWVHMFSSPGI